MERVGFDFWQLVMRHKATTCYDLIVALGSCASKSVEMLEKQTSCL